MTMSYEYAAGFFDGEGSVGVEKKGGWPAIRVAVANTDHNILRELKESWGGQIYKGQRQKPQHKQHWRWRIYSRQAAEFLRDVFPYLKIKKERAGIALAIQATIKHGGYHKIRVTPETWKFRLSLIEELKRLNVPGAEMEKI